MRVHVLFFGIVKDIAGRSEETVELADDGNVESVFEHCAGVYPGLRKLRSSLVLARNRQFCRGTERIEEGDEIAFLPPVSGGAGQFTHEIFDEGTGNFFALTRDPIDTRRIADRLARGEDGAVVHFEGVVRNNSKGRATRYLEYEGYESMAIQVMAGIGREIAASDQVGRIAMVHRLGRLEIGETSVAVIATAPHRKPAFEAALEGINRLKRLVPIWKKEHFVDGATWVEGEWDESVLGR